MGHFIKLILQFIFLGKDVSLQLFTLLEICDILPFHVKVGLNGFADLEVRECGIADDSSNEPTEIKPRLCHCLYSTIPIGGRE